MSRLSLAQTLPPELLARIFGWLVEIRSREISGARTKRNFTLVEWPITAKIPDLRDCCLVCRGWRPSAQALLFHSLRLSQVDLRLLSATLERRPHLAQAVQAIELATPSVDGRGRVAHEAWEATLTPFASCRNIRHVTFTWIPLALRKQLLDFLIPLSLESLFSDPRGWRVRGVTGRSVLSLRDLEAVAQKPTLRHLVSVSTAYPLDFDPPFPQSATSSSFLIDLSLKILHNEDVGVAPLLSLVTSTLVYLDIYTERPLTYANFGHALQNLTAVQEMRIISNCSGKQVESAWFTDILPRMASLRKLAVDADMVPCAALARVPASLQLLEYCWQGVDLIHFLHKLTNVLARMRPSYTTFRLVAYVEFEDEGDETLAHHAAAKLERVLNGIDIELDYHFDFRPRDFPPCPCISFFCKPYESLARTTHLSFTSSSTLP
ncbi:hypothetical protein NBRC10513_005552 [Rhodotorula toruloides]